MTTKKKKELTELQKILKELKRDRVDHIYVKLGTSEASPEPVEYIIIDNPEDDGCLLIMEDRTRIPARGMKFIDASDAIFNTAHNEGRPAQICVVYYNGKEKYYSDSEANNPMKEFDKIFNDLFNGRLNSK